MTARESNARGELFTLRDGTRIMVSAAGLEAFDQALRDAAPDHFDDGLRLGTKAHPLRQLLEPALLEAELAVETHPLPPT